MKEKNDECSAEIGSVTQAMKAQDFLSAAAIPSKVIKSRSSSRHGCIYGVAYSCSQENNVRAVLANARISVKHWNQNLPL
ncbi:MAG: DUF3343 domain-containing protein [Clostridia bacterium]|nr:DUF3343 domain-containing protein [Clostridia bacterium]